MDAQRSTVGKHVKGSWGEKRPNGDRVLPTFAGSVYCTYRQKQCFQNAMHTASAYPKIPV